VCVCVPKYTLRIGKEAQYKGGGPFLILDALRLRGRERERHIRARAVRQTWFEEESRNPNGCGGFI